MKNELNEDEKKEIRNEFQKEIEGMSFNLQVRLRLDEILSKVLGE